jgi:hypothetical protein
MRLVPKFLFVALVVMAVGCSNTPYVDTDYNSKVNFAALQTYAIAPTKQDVGENLLISPFTFSHLEQVIEQDLSSRYRYISGKAVPDFVVSYHVVIEEKLDPRTYNDMYGFGYWGRGYYYPRSYFYGLNSGVRTYNQGSLIIDIADANGKPLWRGVSQKRLSRGLSQPMQRQVLSEAVTEVLSQFPPAK